MNKFLTILFAVILIIAIVVALGMFLAAKFSDSELLKHIFRLAVFPGMQGAVFYG